jgi:hypothetical protein
MDTKGTGWGAVLRALRMAYAYASRMFALLSKHTRDRSRKVTYVWRMRMLLPFETIRIGRVRMVPCYI